MSERPKRIALIGLGHIGRVQAEAIRRTRGLELIAGHDPDLGVASVLPEGVPFEPTLVGALSHAPDIVVVATPNITHSEVSKQVLARGCTVLIEKPAAVTRKALGELLRFPGAANRLRFALHACYGREVAVAIEQVVGRSLGTPTRFESHFEDPYLTTDASISEKYSGLGDAWLDSGVNALSVLGRFIPLGRLQLQDVTANEHSVDKRVIDCIARFGVAPGSGESEPIRGSIRVRWSNEARKWTLLSWADGTSLRLDHQHEELRINAPEEGENLFRLSTSDNRLINHYLGLFSALSADGGRSMDSTQLGIDALHGLFFDVADALTDTPAEASSG